MFGRGRRVFLNLYVNFLAKTVGEYIWFFAENITTELRKLYGKKKKVRRLYLDDHS